MNQNLFTEQDLEVSLFVAALDGVELDSKLHEKLLKHSIRKDGSLKPEAKVRVGWIVKLIREYGYESKQIE